jgi:hypothetical protein
LELDPLGVGPTWSWTHLELDPLGVGPTWVWTHLGLDQLLLLLGVRADVHVKLRHACYFFVCFSTLNVLGVSREREREEGREGESEGAREREDRLDLFEKVAHLAEAAAVLAHHVHVLVCMHPHHIVHVHASVKGLGLVVTH